MQLRTRHNPDYATFVVTNRFVDVFKVDEIFVAFEVAPDGLPGYYLAEALSETAVLEAAKFAMSR